MCHQLFEHGLIVWNKNWHGKLSPRRNPVPLPLMQGSGYSSSVSKHHVITICRECGGMPQHNLHFGVHGGLSVLRYSYITLTVRAASAHGKHNGSRVNLDTAATKRKIPTIMGTEPQINSP